jgi:hypothetical protein
VNLEEVLSGEFFERGDEVVMPFPRWISDNENAGETAENSLGLEICSDGLALGNLAPDLGHLLVVPRCHVFADQGSL